MQTGAAAERPRSWTPVALALGGNVGDPRRNFRFTVAELAFYTRELRMAPLYRCAALSPIPQPAFLNTAVLARTWLEVEELMAVLKGLELRAGRRVDVRHGPRPLDIDLLLFGDLRLERPELTLPHPHLRQRRFVLQPLADLVPGLRPPGEDRTVGELLDALPPTAGAVEAIDWAPPWP